MRAERGGGVLSEMETITEAPATCRKAVTSHLRVAAPFGFGQAYVPWAMAAIRAALPEVELMLALFEDPAHSLHSGRWDVLVHVGSLADSSPILRRLAPNRRILCASEDQAGGSTLRCCLVRQAQAALLAKVHALLVGMLRGHPDLILDTCSVRA